MILCAAASKNQVFYDDQSTSNSQPFGFAYKRYAEVADPPQTRALDGASGGGHLRRAACAAADGLAARIINLLLTDETTVRRYTEAVATFVTL
jgi:hypothetical protein